MLACYQLAIVGMRSKNRLIRVIYDYQCNSLCFSVLRSGLWLDLRVIKDGFQLFNFRCHYFTTHCTYHSAVKQFYPVVVLAEGYRSTLHVAQPRTVFLHSLLTPLGHEAYGFIIQFWKTHSLKLDFYGISDQLICRR